MNLSKEVGLDSTLGARKNALLAYQPNSRAEMEQAEGVTRHYSHDRDDWRRLMEALFAPPRPATPLGAGLAGVPHPDDCGCSRHRTRRSKRATTHREKANAAQRAYYRRRARGLAAHVDPCGTPPAYNRHLRHGEEPCTACRAAWAEYCREGRKRRKAVAA